MGIESSKSGIRLVSRKHGYCQIDCRRDKPNIWTLHIDGQMPGGVVIDVDEDELYDFVAQLRAGIETGRWEQAASGDGGE